MTLRYDASSIKSLEGMEHIRHRPGMYVGSVELQGLHHIVQELISNSIDEYLVGKCSWIGITVKDNWIEISDNGRGIPHGIMPSGNPVLQDIFGKVNTGGKYDDSGEEGGGYNTSGGMNGQ